MAYGTFKEEEEISSTRGMTGAWPVMALGLVVVACVTATHLLSYSAAPAPIMTLQAARQQKLAWAGFTYEMQDEADKALRMCDIGLLGKGAKCAHHAFPTDITQWTHSEAGQNVWEENQREDSSQSSITPKGPSIGTPGDFGD